MNKKKILLVEDDASLGFVIKDNLSQHNFNVTLCADGESGAKTFTDNVFDICILDVMLPKKDGFSLARHIRTINLEIPILFLTAKSMDEDKLDGFRSGADDYITKPFNMDELLYRLEVFLRRSNNSKEIKEEKTFSVGSFVFDYANLVLKNLNQQKNLTMKEAEVLRLLLINKDRVVKRDEILRSVWGDDDYFMGRSMDVFISKLRKYLKDDPNVQIVNYHGVGFKLSENSTSM